MQTIDLSGFRVEAVRAFWQEFDRQQLPHNFPSNWKMWEVEKNMIENGGGVPVGSVGIALGREWDNPAVMFSARVFLIEGSWAFRQGMMFIVDKRFDPDFPHEGVRQIHIRIEDDGSASLTDEELKPPLVR